MYKTDKTFIKSILSAYDLNKKSLASALNISYQTLNKKLDNPKSLTLEQFHKIAELIVKTKETHKDYEKAHSKEKML